MVPRAHRTSRPLFSFGAVAALVVAGALVPTGATAAATLVVTTVGDAALVSGCSDGVAETTLREALCLATAPGASPATVTVPAGTIQLSGPLSVSPDLAGSVVRVTGAGAGATTIKAAAGTRAFDLDPFLVGGLDLTLEQLTVTGGTGPAADLGGGAILAGSGDPGAPDALTLRECAVTGNANVPSAAPFAAAAGGAVSMTGGSLTIDGCTFSGNAAYGASGGAVAFIAVDSSDTVTITGSTFAGNSVDATSVAGVVGGGAVYVQSFAGQPTTTISRTTFDGNTVTSASPSEAFGSAVWSPAGTTTIEESSVAGGTVTGAAGSGGALHLGAGSVTGSRLVGNATVIGATTTRDAVRGTGVTVTGNWWGCANPPAEAGCQTAPDATTVLPAVVLTGTAAPAAVRAGETSTITATIAMSDGTDVADSIVAALAVAPVQWSAGGVGSVAGDATLGADLTGSGTLTMGGAPATVTVSVDGASVPVSVGLLVPPTVGNPADQTVLENGSAVFTVTASGSPAPSVTWESAAPGSSTWAPVPGATGSTLTVASVTRALDGTRYRAVASNDVGSAATSAAATLTVTWGPEVATAPTPVTVVAGQVAGFSVVAAGNPAPAYQWQTSTDGSTWTDVAGASSATYHRTTTAGDDGLLVRAHLTGAGAGDTTPVVLTVQYTGTLSGPASTTVAEGVTATFSATPVGFKPAPAIRWQRWTGGAWVDVPAASGPTFEVVGAAALDGSQYRAVATSTFVDSTTVETPSPAAVLTVTYGPVVGADPTSVSGVIGEAVTFAASAHGNPVPTVRWQYAAPGEAWSYVPGATGTTYTRTLTAADDGMLVRAEFTGAGVATTASARITVAAAPLVTAEPAPATVDAGGVATFTVGVFGVPAPVLQWQSDASGTWADLLGQTGPTLSVIGSSALDGVQYRAVATNAHGTAASAPALLTVLSAPTVTTPADVTTRPGVAVTFSTTASGRPAPALTWQTSTDGVAWTDAGTGPQLTLTPTLADDGLRVRVVAASTIGSGPVQAIGGPATLTVIEPPSFVGAPPAITAATAGTPVSMSWVVLSSGGTPTWQVSRDGGHTWTAPPAGFTTSTVTGVALVQRLLGAPAVRTGYLAAYTPTAADDGLMVGFTLTNAVGGTARSTTTLDVTVPVTEPPGGTGQQGGSGLSSTGFAATPLLAAALVVLALGGLAVAWSRRLARR